MMPCWCDILWCCCRPLSATLPGKHHFAGCGTQKRSPESKEAACLRLQRARGVAQRAQRGGRAPHCGQPQQGTLHTDAVVHTSLRRWSSKPAAPPRVPSMQSFSLRISLPVIKVPSSPNSDDNTLQHTGNQTATPTGCSQHAANQLPSCAHTARLRTRS